MPSSYGKYGNEAAERVYLSPSVTSVLIAECEEYVTALFFGKSHVFYLGIDNIVLI